MPNIVGLTRGLAIAIAIALTPAAALVGFAATATHAQAQTVSRIVVQGNKRIEAEAVKSYLLIGPGQRYDAARADESFKALYATGLFSDVKLQLQGATLVVTVVENPIINRVAFEGNKKLNDETLKAEVESQSRSVLTRARVQNDTQRILTLYRRVGRYGARVEPKIIELPQNRVDLVFEISEGDKTGISRINFIGNKAFSDSDLASEITTSETGILSWLKSNDVYDPDRLAADQELLRRFYLRNGYADFRVISAVADLDQERNGFFITITVDEGEQYTFGAVNVESSVAALDANLVTNAVQTVEGDTYNLELIDKSLEDLTLEVSRLGYAFAQVRPRGDRNPEAKTISVTYVIEEGPRAYIERINIRGNTRTKDDVIRREFDLVEGDPYNRVMVDRAQRRLNSLGFFKNVEISREPGSAPDRVVLNVNVEEQPTGQLSIGGGYSTTDGFIGDVSVTERNLLGRGQYVRLAVNLSQRRRDVDFSFTEPYFLDRRVSAGFDVFSRQTDLTDESSFESKKRGGAIRFGFPLSEDVSLTTRYQFSQEEVFSVASTASLAIKDAAGKDNVSLVGYTLRFDTVDNKRSPTNGIYAEFSQDVAGLGGDVNYVRTTAEVRAYHEVYKDVIGIVKLQGGHITGFGGKDVRILDSFFKGGETIRGFDRGGFGPRDATTGDALGGSIFAAATAEVQFPIWGIPKDLGFKGALFADAGTLYESDAKGKIISGTPVQVLDSNSIRSSVGVSLLWDSPLGPLRADFAHVLSKERYDDEQFFRFGAATQF